MRPLFLLLALALAGCTTTQPFDIGTPDARAFLAGRAPEARLTLASGVTHETRGLAFTAKKATWSDPRTGAAQSAPLPDVSAVTVRDRSRGAAGGVIIGGVSGLVAGFALGYFAANGSDGFSGDPLSTGILAGALLTPLAAGMGAGIGALREHRTVYLLQPAASSQPSASSASCGPALVLRDPSAWECDVRTADWPLALGAR